MCVCVCVFFFLLIVLLDTSSNLLETRESPCHDNPSTGSIIDKRYVKNCGTGIESRPWRQALELHTYHMEPLSPPQNLFLNLLRPAGIDYAYLSVNLLLPAVSDIVFVPYCFKCHVYRWLSAGQGVAIPRRVSTGR